MPHSKPCRFMTGVLASLIGLVSGATAFAAQQTAKPGQEKLVLCWYMVCFGNSVERYKQEIELAQRHGIDGFLLDVGSWNANKGYVTSSERIYEAAKQLGTGFKLAMAPEYSVQPFYEDVCDMVLKFKDHPNQLKHDGKPVLSAYAAVSMLPGAVAALEAKGVKVCLVADAHIPRWIYNPSYESFADLFTAAPCLDGLMIFNSEQLGNNISRNAMGRRVTQKLGKLFAAGVIPAYNSANLQDYRGLSGYLDMWKGAIDDGADWISIVIWNDYNEDSSPDARPLAVRQRAPALQPRRELPARHRLRQRLVQDGAAAGDHAGPLLRDLPQPQQVAAQGLGRQEWVDACLVNPGASTRSTTTTRTSFTWTLSSPRRQR